MKNVLLTIVQLINTFADRHEYWFSSSNPANFKSSCWTSSNIKTVLVLKWTGQFERHYASYESLSQQGQTQVFWDWTVVFVSDFGQFGQSFYTQEEFQVEKLQEVADQAKKQRYINVFVIH